MKGEFLTKLEYEEFDRDDKKWIRLDKNSLIYRDSKGNEHEAKKGFESDGSSQPKWTWKIIGHPFGRYLPAAVIHDRLCELKNISYFKRNWVFLDAMKTLNVPFWKRHLMFNAVNLFGGVHDFLISRKRGKK